MIDPVLEPGYVIYTYDVTSAVSYKHEGKTVTVKSFDVDTHPASPEKFAATVTTTDDEALIYFSDRYGLWPAVVKRLFHQHVVSRRATNV